MQLRTHFHLVPVVLGAVVLGATIATLSTVPKQQLQGSALLSTSQAASTNTFCCSRFDPTQCIFARGAADCDASGFDTNDMCPSLPCNAWREINSSRATTEGEGYVYCCVNNGLREVCAGTKDITQCTGGINTDPLCTGEPCARSSEPPDDEEECELSIVGDVVQRCCRKTKYSPYYFCQHYSQNFNELCAQEGIEGCKRINVRCKDSAQGHQLNTVPIGGKLCFVDSTTGRILTCDTDTKEGMDRAICLSMGKDYPCECQLTDDNVSSAPPDFASCALKNSSDESLCKLCCDSKLATLSPCDGRDPPPLCDNYKRDCYNACDQYINHTRVCPIPGQCYAGYIPGTCNPDTCLQEYNTGYCNLAGSPNPNGCAILMRSCLNPGANCTNPGNPDRDEGGGGSW